MSLVASDYVIWPAPYAENGVANLLLDASGEKAAVIFRVPKDGNIRKVHFRLGTVTTGQTLKASLQDVDPATGTPDGTVDQSGTVTVADTDDNTWKTVTFGADRAVTRGAWLACVIEFDSTVGNLNITKISSASLSQDAYTALYTGTWAKSSDMPVLAIEYDDGSFGVMTSVQPFSSTNVVINTGTTPDEAGVKFTLPFPAKCAGILYWGSAPASSDLDAVLYDSDGSTALATASLDADIVSDTSLRLRLAPFSSEITLEKNVAYRAVIKPTTATSFTFRYALASNAAHLAQAPGGTGFHMTQRTDAGSWTDTTTQRPYMAILISQLDDGASGGIKRHPGMTGNCPA